MEGERNRINEFHGWALIIVAAWVDFFQFFLTLIPVIGVTLAFFFSVLARLTFSVWFFILGVGFADKTNRFVVNIAVTIGEMIPFIGALPMWTIGTIAIIRQVRTEDAAHNEELRKKTQAQEVPEQKRSKMRRSYQAANDNTPNQQQNNIAA